jgi:hypothetical protein
MSRSNHTEAQMIGALKQLEAGRKAEDVARDPPFLDKRLKRLVNERLRMLGCSVTPLQIRHRGL